jgi:hypothetical protein
MKCWLLIVCACVACTTHDLSIRPRIAALPRPTRVTMADPALIQSLTLFVGVRSLVAPKAIEQLQAHRAKAPDDELPIIDELLVLFGMTDVDDEDCVPRTRAFAARARTQFVPQLMHLTLLESVVFRRNSRMFSFSQMRWDPAALARIAALRVELAAFSADLATRFPDPVASYQTLARLCETEAVAPEDEESHTRECVAIYDKCHAATPNAFCETKATELRALDARPQCHTKNIDPTVHVRYGFDDALKGRVPVYADGRTIFVDPVDAFDSTDFVRLIASGRGSSMRLTSGARARPYRVADVAVVMKGTTIIDTVRNFAIARDDGTVGVDGFELPNVGVERVCMRVERNR